MLSSYFPPNSPASSLSPLSEEPRKRAPRALTGRCVAHIFCLVSFFYLFFLQICEDRDGRQSPGAADPPEEDRGQTQAEGAARGEQSFVLRACQAKRRLALQESDPSETQEAENLASRIKDPLYIF